MRTSLPPFFNDYYWVDNVTARLEGTLSTSRATTKVGAVFLPTSFPWAFPACTLSPNKDIERITKG